MNTDELNFAYKVRHALNQNLENLPASKVDRLTAARNIALSRKKKNSAFGVFSSQSALAGHAGKMLGLPVSWLSRMGSAIPLLMLVGGLIAIYQFEQQQRISETASIDAEMLSDELPLTAYLDHGFNAYLAKRGE